MKPNLLLLCGIVALLASGCCSYNGRPSHGHGHHGDDDYHHASQLPGHGAVTPLPPGPAYPPAPPTQYPSTPPVSQLPANPPPPVGGQGSGPGNVVLADGETKLELKKESFAVNKRVESGGSARIRKYIVRENVSVPITLCHDDLQVDRAPASGDTNMPWWEGETYIEVPFNREIAVPTTTQRVYEMVRIRKSTICETNSIGGIVRTEKVDVIR